MRAFIFAVALLPTLALAAEKLPQAITPIDMTVVIKDSNGTLMKDQFTQKADDPSCAKCEPLTIGAAIANALDARYKDEENLNWEQMYSRGHVASYVRGNTTAHIDAAQAKVIEKCLGRLYGPYVLAVIVPLIDPNFMPPALQ